MIDELGDRMKNNYENAYRINLPRRMPVIIRIDARSFHRVCKKIELEKPLDKKFIASMAYLANAILGDVQNCKFAYAQSDEISFLLTDYDELTTQAWFGNNLQKLVSVTAGLASAKMSRLYDNEIIFDSRAFVIPPEEVCNYFIWRQKDWMRNCVNMVGQYYFSHKELHGKSKTQVEKMLEEKGIDMYGEMYNYITGTAAAKQLIDLNPPNFTLDRNYINKHLPNYNENT
jgi:tRNA(His) 5'-end guanylyltransferase